MYAFAASEELLELTIINSARKLDSILFCQPISPQALGNFCDWVGSSPASSRCVTVRLLYHGFVHKRQVAKLDILSSEVGILVEVMFVLISQLHLGLYGSIDSFSLSFQLPCSSRLQRYSVVDSLGPVGSIQCEVLQPSHKYCIFAKEKAE